MSLGLEIQAKSRIIEPWVWKTHGKVWKTSLKLIGEIVNFSACDLPQPSSCCQQGIWVFYWSSSVQCFHTAFHLFWEEVNCIVDCVLIIKLRWRENIVGTLFWQKPNMEESVLFLCTGGTIDKCYPRTQVGLMLGWRHLSMVATRDEWGEAFSSRAGGWTIL